MADLVNDGGTLRLALVLAGREAEGPRAVAAAGLEYRDRRDGAWWPLLRLPALRLPTAALQALRDELLAFLRGDQPGFAWSSGDGGPLAIQLGRAEGGAVVEVGLDVSLFLEEVAGAKRREQAELALFRFRALVPARVVFSERLRAELEELGP